MGLLDNTLIPFLAFWRTSILLALITVLIIYISRAVHGVTFSTQHHQSLTSFILFFLICATKFHRVAYLGKLWTYCVCQTVLKYQASSLSLPCAGIKCLPHLFFWIEATLTDMRVYCIVVLISISLMLSDETLFHVSVSHLWILCGGTFLCLLTCEFYLFAFYQIVVPQISSWFLRCFLYYE